MTRRGSSDRALPRAGNRATLPSGRERTLHVYGYILEYKSMHDGAMPTMREISENCSIPSLSTVSYYLNQLERAGKLKRLENNVLVVVGARWIPPGKAV